MQSKLWSRLMAFLVWALVAGSAVAWGLQWSGRFMAPARSLPLPAGGASDGAYADPVQLARALGAMPAPNAPQRTETRLTLIGVVAGQGASAALISVDGKPPTPFTGGSAVDVGLVLQSVSPKRALLGPTLEDPATLTLEMPTLQKDKD